MFIVVRHDAETKLKVMGDMIENEADALAHAKQCAYKGNAGDSFYVCEFKAKVTTKLIIDTLAVLKQG